jgi:hypothetical protein
MGFHPANLTFRFILEVVGLVGIFRLGLRAGNGALGWVLAVLFTLAAMTVWANFRVPGDASAKGDAPYAVAGPVRLGIESLVFAAGAFGWFISGPVWVAWSYLAGVALHHLLSYDRVIWLFKVSAAGDPPFVQNRE